jgi:nucleoside-diphosphate-sugar epimerase
LYDLFPSNLLNAQPQYVVGDIRDAEALTESMRGCDRVLHLAAAHHDFGLNEATFYSVNEQGAVAICDAMDQNNIREVCFYSSVAVYGDAEGPYTEEAMPKPVSFYGKSKLAGEKVFANWAAKGDGRRCLVIRPTVTFGPGNFANMYSLIRQIERRKFLPVGEMRNVKSLAYVENIVAATLYLWNRPVEKRSAFEVFNYVDKPDFTSRQIVNAIYEDLGKKAPAWNVPYALARLLAVPFDVVITLTGKNLPVSSARLKKLVASETKYEADKVLQAGFRPPISLRDSIARMVRWYQAEGRAQAAVHRLPPPQMKQS